MDTPPRLVAILAFLALVPIGAYALLTGELTLITGVLAVVNLALIGGSLFVLFGPSNGEQGHAAH